MAYLGARVAWGVLGMGLNLCDLKRRLYSGFSVL